MPIVIGLGDTSWNDPLNLYGGKPTIDTPRQPAPVGDKRRFTLTDQDRQDLRKTIAAEAAGEGETGMIAVGNVIRNRAERRGKGLADVVREPKQFTGYEAPGEGALKILQDPDQLAKIDSIIDRMASGELPDITDGADHYHAKTVSPSWANQMPKTTEVGQHLFYRAETGPDTRNKANQIGLGENPFDAVLSGQDTPSEKAIVSDVLDAAPTDGKATAKSAAKSADISVTGRSPIDIAATLIGKGEVPDRETLQEFFKNGGQNLDPATTAWCAAFVNSALGAAGIQGTGKLNARSFLDWGEPVDTPQRGDIAVFTRGGNNSWKGHVAFFDSVNPDGSINVLGGNQGDQVSVKAYAADRLLGYRRPPSGSATPKGNTIVLDESFTASDPMGLLAGGNPFAAIADEAKSRRVAEETQVADQFEQNRITGMTQVANRETEARRAELEAESPGRYVEMTAEEVPEFQRQWEEENRSDGVLGDTGRILKSGAIGVGQTLTSLADTIFSNIPGGEAFLKASDDIDRWAMGQTLDQRMDTAKAQTNASVTKEQSEADAKNWWDSENGTFGPAWRDPRSYLRTVGESVPATVVTMAPGGIMARGAYLRTLAATGSERAAAAAAAKTATVAGALLEGTMGGADTARAVRDRIDAIPREQLIETETVRALIDGGMSEDEALTALTTDASTKAFAIAGVATGMFGGMGDRALAKILAEGVGGNIAQRMLAGGARGMVAEGLLEEAPQGAAQTIAGNIGVRDANPDQELTEGMGEAVASGIAGGGVMGGGMGAAGGAISRQGAASAGDPVEDAPAAPAAAPPAPAAAPQPRGPIGRSVQHAEQQITQRQAAAAPADVIPAPAAVTESLTPAPSASSPDAALAQDGRPQVGATVRIDADGIEPFMGRVDGYEGDDAVIIDGASGEVYQIPIGNLTEIAKPMEAIPDRGPQPVNDAIPEFSTDPALEPMAPAAAEVRSEGLPPRSEQKEATERFPSAPTAGQRVIVDDENGGRFVATVQGYENGGTEALIRTDDGKDLQVPVSSLKVSKLTPKQVEAQELERNPPIEREVADAGPTSRSVLGKTIVMPDDKHARLFDLGKMRQSSRRTIGTSQLDLDRVDPRGLKALANEFGIPEQAVGQLADDYATRMVRNVRSANSKLPQRMPPVMDTILARWRREVVDADTSPAADETQSWWDRELDDEGRRLAMISANIKRPPKTPWVDLSPAMQRKLGTVRSEQQDAEAAAGAVDSTEANSVESEASNEAATEVQSVDEAANEAATSPTNDLPEPTPAQKEAGNYKVGRLALGGLDISIENPAGSERKGMDEDGNPWSVTMKSHYGYIRGTVGRDKDHIDVFVKPGTGTLEGTAPVFVVDQVNPDGSFDEHKVMLGYGSQREAEAAYLENYSEGWKLGPVSSTMFGEFKQWLRKGDTTEGAASAVNERYFDDAATQARAEEVDRPKPTVAQIHKDMANRVSPTDFARRVAALGRNSQESAVIEPGGKLLVLKPTSNPFGDHAEFFERLTEAGVDTTESTGYVRITSSGNQIGASSSGPISDPAAATLRAVQTAAAREGLTFVGEGVEQPAAQVDTAGSDTERTVNGKRLAFPDKYHAAVFDLGQQLLSEAGVAEVRAGTLIDDVVPEAATLTKAQRAEAERLVSTIGSYMDPVVSSADEMAIAAMEIAAMEMEVAASKKGDGEVPASSVIDVEAQQEWAQAIIDEMSKGQPVTARQPMETGAEPAATGPMLAFSADNTAATATLEPKPNKQADPDPIMPTDPKFRRLPVPDRPASTPLFTWAKDAVLERGRRTGNEHLIAIDDDGTVVEFGTSDKPKFVGLNARLSKAVANPDRRLVFIHNHPRNWPLSVGDVAMLANPGAYSVWALGHDGRETRASLTERAQRAVRLGSAPDDVINSIERFEKALRDAEKGLEAIIGGKIADGTITVEQAEEAHFNAILEVGQRAGVIDFTTNQPYDPSNIPMLDRAIDNAALKLARTLLDERAAPQTSDARILRQAVSVQHVGELGTVAGDRSDVEGRDEGQRGLREGSARDYQSEAQGRNARRLTSSRRISENSIVEAISGKWTDLNPTVLATVPLNYFVELARPNMTAVKEYMSVKRLMDAYRGDKHANADAIAGDWLKYMRLGFGKTNKAKAQELADLMHDSTLAGIDPSLTDDETKGKAGYDILRKRYQALPASGKELFGKVRDAYRAQADELDQILLDNVRKSQQIAKDQAEARYRKKLEEIRDAKMNPIDRRKAEEDAASRYKAESTKMDWSAKARLTKMRIQFESNRVPAPYFPLGRFGQYYVTAKDVDGSVISFSKFERAADRDRFAREIQRDYPGAAVTKGVMKDMTDPRAAMDPRMVAEIEQLLGNAGVDQDLMDMVYQRYLETLPELSMRKRYMHRKGTAGFDTDALRVFSSHMFHAAHQLAKLKYGLELQELVNTTFDQAEAADDQTRAMRLANEMKDRHRWVMSPTGSSFAQTMTSTAFVWFLAASPAAAVLNLTQTLMMGLPILGARFGGIGRASVEVAKASADLISGKGSVRNANLSREEAAAVDAFYRSGMIDRTQSHDLAGVGDTGVKYSPLRSRVMAVMSWAFHNTEVWNRETTALAAYRLARKAGQDHLKAIDSAHDLTWATHFDYSNSSRPRLMQNDYMKVALVFRSYSLNMLFRLFRDMHQSVKGESPQARREARYQLAGVTGMMALMSGVTGVWGFNLAMAVAGTVFGDDDDPMDFEETFKKDMLDILGPELGGVVLKGVPGHYLGIDLTSRIGMPDLWFRSPSQDLQGKEEWNYWTSQMLGATAGIGEQWFRGASLIMEGDVARGVEVAAPKFIRDPMKAFRYANEGLQSIRGDELLPADAIGIHGAVAQAMGVSPAIVSETWERSGALKNAEKRVMDERQRVVNAWAMAALAKDKEAVAEAIERIKAFNKKPVHSAIPITQDTLKRSIKTRVRNAAKREDGVLIQNEILSQRLRAAMPERLY